MTTSLLNNLPYAAPYAEDPVGASEIPSNVTDWILVQVRFGLTSTPVFARSAFLQYDGQISTDNGASQMVIEVSPGSTNYLMISHRNHLSAMSAQPIVFTNQTLQYSFTTGSGQYYGGTNAAVQLEPGVWGLIAGDADGDGKITAVDKGICEQQVGQSGYLAGDFNLDGVVTTNKQ
jgi:hypothetical protein